MLKLCCISDTHGKYNQLDLTNYPADVLIHAGDWTAKSTKTQILSFLEWFDVQPFNHKILVAGNHETLVEEDQDWFYKALQFFPEINYLQDSEMSIDGIKFYGSPYSNEFYEWAFMEDEWDLQAIWDKIPDDTNVLITHGPAYGCHDLVKHAYGRDPHVGSQSLHYKKLALQGTLKAHICGHIHENYGTSIVHSWVNVNAAVLNDRYKLVNTPIVIEV